MNLRHKYFLPLLGVVALLQIGVLGKMVADRLAVLKSGQEVVLPVRPVDPRDFLRGDYVVLGYDLSPLTLSEVELGRPFSDFQRGQEVYVVWRANADGTWSATKLSPAPLEVAGTGEIAVKGRIEYMFVPEQKDRRTFTIRYGIESYFVPEGTGATLEQAVRDKKIEAIVAVGKDGTAALKGLVVAGERHLDPPLL